MLGFWINLAASPGDAEELITPALALSKMFPEATIFDHKTIDLSLDDIKQLDARFDHGTAQNFKAQYVLHIALRGESIVGYALEDVEQGKWGPIHFICAILPEGTVKEVQVLSYNENRGRPVAKKRFLKQFAGKSLRDPLRLRGDIDGVTGATISSRAMTEGVKKMLLVFQWTMQ